MTKPNHQPPASPRELNTLTPETRNLIYARCGLTGRQASQVEQMLAKSGAREIGRGALNNVIGLFHSRKNAATRLVESHTCEQLFAYELELDPEVVWYQTQILCQGVTRLCESGRRHISAPHVDFLVFRSASIELVECKTEEWLKSRAPLTSGWHQGSDGIWHRPHLEDWAAERGMRYMVWAPKSPTGIYLRNLELIYAAGAADLRNEDASVARAAHKLLERRSYTLAELADAIRGFPARVALWLLATRRAFGLIRSTSIDLPDHFRLFLHKDQAEHADATALMRLVGRISDQAVTDPLCVASATDVRYAKQRLERLNAIDSGSEPGTRRMRNLAKKVAAAVAAGRTPIEACLTAYQRSGNRTPRMIDGQQEAIEEIIRTYWGRSAVGTQNQLHNLLEELCTQRGLPTPSFTTLNRRLRSQDPAVHALRTAGMRGFQAVRAMSDPRSRSLKALAFGHTLHIDSSDVDWRAAPEHGLQATAEKPRFYIGVDECASVVMSHALYFGSPHSDAFAMLIREYVHRHGHLPCAIFVDRGPEHRSNWLKDFCFAHGITLRYSPTAGSRFNSLAEAAIRQANTSVAHRLEGHTRLDAMGRAADARFKSRANARTRFVTFHEAFVHYLYNHHPKQPDGEGLSPCERKEDALALFGMAGRPQAFDEGFLIQTSIPFKYARRGSERHGIRTPYGSYTSDALRLALRSSHPQDVRRDCIDPTLLYVRVQDHWYRAYHSKVLSAAQFSTAEKIWLSVDWDSRRRTAKESKAGLSREHDRYMRALRGRAAQEHLLLENVAVQPETSKVAAKDLSKTVLTDDAFEPFPEE